LTHGAAQPNLIARPELPLRIGLRMAASVDINWQYCGLDVVRLENEVLCVDVLPQLGAKIWNFVHKPSGRNLLWHNPNLLPSRQAYGARFDDNWCGGWDEIIPNDVPATVGFGDLLPDHGEVWSQATAVEVLSGGPEACAVRFTVRGRVYPTVFQKTLRLGSCSGVLHVDYRYENRGDRPIDFLWTIHPAMSISPKTRLDVPAARVICDPWGDGRCEAWSEHRWPHVRTREGQLLDLSLVPPAGAGGDFFYLPDIAEGWYAVTDQEAKVGFGLVFPREVFPHLWLFRALGGWRGLYTLILEAAAGYPNDLALAKERGQCARLAPGEALEAHVLAVAYVGVVAVERIAPDGTIVPATRACAW